MVGLWLRKRQASNDDDPSLPSLRLPAGKIHTPNKSPWNYCSKLIVSKYLSVWKATVAAAACLAGIVVLYRAAGATYQELEWRLWERSIQRSISKSVPPLPTGRFHGMFPPMDKSELPEYDVMAEIRGVLASRLRSHVIRSDCSLGNDVGNNVDNVIGNNFGIDTGNGKGRLKSLPVMGITVAHDTPAERYLRRLLFTIDLAEVHSIVVTWYDEHSDETSRDVVEQTLAEFIAVKGLLPVDWNQNHSFQNHSFQEYWNNPNLASKSSLHLMSRIATIHQYCLPHNPRNSTQISCQNELLILQFSTNLGCSFGFNNPLFTHPQSSHWLLVNHDIAYPPQTLRAMGHSIQQSMQYTHQSTRPCFPNVALYTFGYIYGRGTIQNPWSNFVITSHAIHHVGLFDEDIFPAYYEDDDYRDRVRYILGEWTHIIHSNSTTSETTGRSHQLIMNDAHLIRYQTTRSVSVAHGPLSAKSYIMGTHSAMKSKDDDATRRWNIIRYLSDTKRYFLCKHGGLPGEGSLRYFDKDGRFTIPFGHNDHNVTYDIHGDSHDLLNEESPWSTWRFNATRRKCVHEGANQILSSDGSPEEIAEMTRRIREECSVC